MKLLKQAEYMAATGFTLHQTIAFRSGLGPYKAQGLWLLKTPKGAKSRKFYDSPS
jgi:hypothetical protein